MVTRIRTLYDYREQDSIGLQGAGLCKVIGSRSLQGYREQDYVWLKGAGLCKVTGMSLIRFQAPVLSWNTEQYQTQTIKMYIR